MCGWTDGNNESIPRAQNDYSYFMGQRWCYRLPKPNDAILRANDKLLMYNP